jgi:hypothetical protein
MKLLDIIFESVADLNEGPKFMTQDEFIKNAQIKHQNDDRTPKYTYDNVDYVNSKTYVLITCPTHGDFPQLPSRHLQGAGCYKCGKNRLKLKSEDFIKRSQKIHQNDDRTPKYTYDNVVYVNKRTPIMITCPTHGDFPQTPGNHLQGAGCRYCMIDSLKSNKDEFIKGAQSVRTHQNDDRTPKYTYDNVDYGGTYKKVMITCPTHGDFPQTPGNHLQGAGCPYCKESKGEKEIKKILKEKNIENVFQKKYEDCISHKSKNRIDKRCYKLEFDFYLPDYNTLVEFDGGYHFSGKMYDNHDYISSVLNDREKNDYTKAKNIKLIRIGYLDKENIEEELMKGLDSNDQLYLSTKYPIDKGWRDTTIKV